MNTAIDMVTTEMVQERLDSWDARDWDGIRENYAEYRGSLGDEATKSFKEFAVGIATQNCLFAVMMEA